MMGVGDDRPGPWAGRRDGLHQRSAPSGDLVMIGASLATLLILGQPPSSSPTVLVEQLGSPRFAERERASEALERLGARD